MCVKCGMMCSEVKKKKVDSGCVIVLVDRCLGVRCQVCSIVFDE